MHCSTSMFTEFNYLNIWKHLMLILFLTQIPKAKPMSFYHMAPNPLRQIGQQHWFPIIYLYPYFNQWPGPAGLHLIIPWDRTNLPISKWWTEHWRIDKSQTN